MQSNLPAPWRCCRLQLVAFILLHLLGSCSQPASSRTADLSAVPLQVCPIIGPITLQQASACLPA